MFLLKVGLYNYQRNQKICLGRVPHQRSLLIHSKHVWQNLKILSIKKFKYIYIFKIIYGYTRKIKWSI